MLLVLGPHWTRLLLLLMLQPRLQWGRPLLLLLIKVLLGLILYRYMMNGLAFALTLSLTVISAATTDNVVPSIDIGDIPIRHFRNCTTVVIL